MLDAAFFQDKIQVLQEALKKRRAGSELITKLAKQASERKELIQEGEKLKALRNSASQEIAQLKAKGKRATRKRERRQTRKSPKCARSVIASRSQTRS